MDYLNLHECYYAFLALQPLFFYPRKLIFLNEGELQALPIEEQKSVYLCHKYLQMSYIRIFLTLCITAYCAINIYDYSDRSKMEQLKTGTFGIC